MPPDMDLANRWQATWRSLLLTPRAGLRDELLARYAEPHRAYHTWEHLRECFATLDPVRSLAQRPGEVELALWFHDAVYDPQRHDNEAQSADWLAREVTAVGAEPALPKRLRGLVLATRHHEPPPAGDAALLVDVDLAILGAEPARFDQYEQQIRAEYGFVPEAAFRAARAQILERMLARPRLFATDVLAAQLESPARANLQRSLARLRG